MTMRSNQVEGDLISFQYYDASEDVVLDIVETVSFVDGAQIGDWFNPFTFNIGVIFEVDLISGYNWISFNLLSDYALSMKSAHFISKNWPLKKIPG